MRHITSVTDLDDSDLDYVVGRSAWFAGQESEHHRPLTGYVVGSYFGVTSTRTRTAFASAALSLGAGHIAYGPQDLLLNTGESLPDTARVFASMLDARAPDPGDL